MKRATKVPSDNTKTVNISIHTLCEEGDLVTRVRLLYRCRDFNPHPLWRGRPSKSSATILIFSNFNPHPLWRGRQLTRKLVNGLMAISIHTLCEEGDIIKHLTNAQHREISIHTLCEEGDCANVSEVKYGHFYFNPHPLWRGRPRYQATTLKRSIFQSTPSVKRATSQYH